MKQEPVGKAYIAAILLACLTGFSFLANKIALQNGTVMDLLAWRYFFALVGALLVAAAHKDMVRQVRANARFLYKPVITYITFMYLQAASLSKCTSVVVAIIFAFMPVVISLLGWIILKESLTGLQILGVAAGLGALLCIIWLDRGSMEFSLIGILMASVAMFLLALYAILLRQVRHVIKPMEATLSTSVVGGIVFSVGILLYHGFKGDWHVFFSAASHGSFLASTAYLGIGCILVTTALTAYANSHLPAARAGAFGNLSTVVSVAAGALILQEPIHGYHILSALVIILGVFLTNSFGHKEAPMGERRK